MPAFVTRFPGDGCCGGHGGVEMAELFEYKAWDHTGKLVSGTMEAERPDEVASRLRVRGYFPSTVRPARPKQSLLQFSRRRKPGPRDLSVLCRQLAVMVETGIPLVTSLQLLASQQRHAALKEALEETRRDVSGGSSLTESLRKHDRIFPGLFLDMVEVGESSGHLPEVLNRLADFYQRDAKLRGDIKQAMAYPTVIILFGFAVTLFVMFYVLPTFAGIFADFGVELPAVSGAILAVRDFIVRNIVWFLLSAVAAAAASRYYFRTPAGRRLRDAWILRLPVVGELVSKVIFARFARTLSLLFVSGFPMVRSLQSCEKIVGNAAVAADLAAARAGVQRGSGISEPLRREAKVFPPMLVEMIRVGEETGELDAMLDQAAGFYELEVEQSVKTLTSIIEPLILVLLGGVIFLIVLSVFVPMFNMANVIQ